MSDCTCAGWDGSSVYRAIYCAPCKKAAKREYDRLRGQRADVKARWADASRRWHQRGENKRLKSARVLRVYRSTVGGLHMRMSRGIRGSLQGTKKGGVSWLELVPYTLDELRVHLERQFTKGMSWGNMGEWHIDHIVPLASFSISSAADPEFGRAWSLTNLRPLWARENLAKRDRRVTLL